MPGDWPLHHKNNTYTTGADPETLMLTCLADFECRQAPALKLTATLRISAQCCNRSAQRATLQFYIRMYAMAMCRQQLRYACPRALLHAFLSPLRRARSPPTPLPHPGRGHPGPKAHTAPGSTCAAKNHPPERSAQTGRGKAGVTNFCDLVRLLSPAPAGRGRSSGGRWSTTKARKERQAGKAEE